MNFVKSSIFIKSIFLLRVVLYFYLTFILFVSLNGCSDKVILPSVNQLNEFENAGPLRPTVDLDRLVRAKISGGPYRVVPGEVLELTMPAILRVITTDDTIGPERDEQYICRISESGTIILPVVGEIKVEGKTLAQIESDIIDKYYPEYTLIRPSVFVRVLEYMTVKVSISGAVREPGVYSLHNDQMSLVNLLMEAGGIIDEGAALIRIIHSEYETEPDDERHKVQNIWEDHESIKAGTKESSASYQSLNDIEVQLSFRQESAQNTVGTITVSNYEKVLLIDQMDIASEIERLVLLKRLSIKEPRVSIIQVETKLSELAESLKLRSGRLKEKSSAYITVLTEIENGQNKNWAMHDKITEQEPKVSIRMAQQSFDSSEIKDSMYYSGSERDVSRDMFSQAAFNINNTKPDVTTTTVVNGELLEKPDVIVNRENNEETVKEESQKSESFVLPVKGFNIPFADVALQDGDSVIVERLSQPLFSVIGLVNRPGNFSYPPDVQYNLMQALAFAGGLDLISEPRYATVYRLKSDGTVCHATFEIIKSKNSSQLTDALDTPIKPGDIVSVEHTPRTRINLFFDRAFRLNIGTYYNLSDAWED